MLVGFAVATFASLTGFGAHGESGPGTGLIVFFFGSWTFVLLVLTALGALVVANTVLPLVRLDAETTAIEMELFWDRPRWYQVGRAAKGCCGVVVVALCVPLLLSVGTLVLEQVVPVPGPVVTFRRFWAHLSMFVLPVFAIGLVLSVFVHALGRMIGTAFEAVSSAFGTR